MTSRYKYIITPQNLRSAAAGLSTGKTLDHLFTFLSIISVNARKNLNYFNENEELSKVLFTETFPTLIEYFISQRMYSNIISIMPIYVNLCSHMSIIRKFTFLPFMVKFFKIAKSLSSHDSDVYFQYQLKCVKKSAKLNIFQKILIELIARQKIIQVLINDFLFHQSFDEIKDYFDVFNEVFPYLEKSVLLNYEEEFSRFSYLVDDQRFDNPVSVKLTRAMAECSSKYAQLHFDNIIKFLMSDFDDDIKDEFVDLIKNTENLKCIQNSLLEMIDLILAAMREDEEKLREISSILISNEICDVNLFFEKAGSDVYFNAAFFDLFKENYTTEHVENIMNSEEFCEQTAEFGFKIIDYKIDLILDLSSFLQKCYSSFWNEDRMNEIVTLSKEGKNRKILLDSINNFEIENYKIYKIVLEILFLFKPSTDEFNYNCFVDKVLYYTDSIFLVPFLTINSFIPTNLIDVEDLVSFSVFNEQLSDFLFDNFSDDLINHIEFFLELQIDDEIENKCLSKFLFNLYKKYNSNENNRLIWESVIRSQDKDEEIHSFAQKIINENPSSSQKEILEKIENGYSKFFINFDFSNFDESSAEENGYYLFFEKPKLVSVDSFFYLPSKICHALNHNEKIEESEIKELFDFQIGDIGIDAVLLSISFDAAMKLNIEFTPIKQSLDVAFQLKYKKFVKKLLQYIINNSKEVVQIDDELINSFAEIDANYAVKLIKKKNVIDQILNLLYIKYQTFSALSILRKTENKIQIGLLDNIIYSKLDFIDFIKSNRIDENEILPFIFSNNFPQFYRTKFLMNFLFQRIQSNPQLLHNFLTSLKIEKKGKFVKYTHSFIPFIDSKFYSAYLSFALSIPDFYNYPKPKFAAFLSNLIYEKEGEENQNILSPIKELSDNNQKFRASRKLFYQFLDIIISELPNRILKNFELQYSTKNSLSSSESKVFHDYSLFINNESISEDLKKYFFFNQPKILLFKIQKLIELQIEENIFINKKRYSLSCFGTKTSVYIPHKSNKKYVKYSNGSKSYSDFIEGKIIFIFYQLIDDTNDYEILKNRFKKFKSSDFNFNKRAIICDSLNKAEIEWKNWKKDEILFNIAKNLMSEIGYTELFKELSDNQAFSEFFFKSDWKEKYSLFDINKEMINLANIYPNREELVELLINSLKEDNKKHFSSIILNSFDLNDEAIQNVIKNISPPYDNCKDLIVNYFLKKTTSNEPLQNNENLAKFVLSEIEKLYSNKIEWETIKSLELIPYNHLLSPMTESLFLVCNKALNKTTNDLILQSFENSPSTIAHSLSILPHGDKLVSLFCGIKTNEETTKELRNNLDWVIYSLSSFNEQIRKHSIELIKYVFKCDEGFLLSAQLREAILRSLTYPYVDEVVFFINDYFGYKCIDSSEFVSKIYDKLFSVEIPDDYQSIESLFNELSPPLPSSIIKWHYVIKNIKNNDTLFLVYSSDLLYAAIKSGFKPPFVGFLEDIIAPLHLEVCIDTIRYFFKFMKRQIDQNGVFDTIKIILEFEVVVCEYINFISTLLLNYSDFRETETIILALYLPSVVLKRREFIKKKHWNDLDEKSLMVEAIEKTTTALSFILKKDNKNFGFIRKSGIKEIEQIMTDYYYNSYLVFFSVDFFVAIDLLGVPNNSTKEYRISSLKKLLKFATLSSLAFRDVLKIMFDLLCKTPGLRIFNDLLSNVELEWCELCCEIAREILSDIQFKDQIKQAVFIVDRELCTQLYHFNMAEKGYLKFLTAVMKDDHLRIQSCLQCNPQIFNVLRNNFVFCIDDVTSFIDISIDKYNDFFNADDIKNFILKLQINDNQIKQKLKIVLILLDKCSEKMKPLIEEIFPKIEELSSSEFLNDEISELINQVLEQALVVLSLID